MVRTLDFSEAPPCDLPSRTRRDPIVVVDGSDPYNRFLIATPNP
jgi:hypothetical protein